MGGYGAAPAAACWTEEVGTDGACIDNDIFLGRAFERCDVQGASLSSISYTQICDGYTSSMVIVSCCPLSGTGGSPGTGGTGTNTGGAGSGGASTGGIDAGGANTGGNSGVGGEPSPAGGSSGEPFAVGGSGGAGAADGYGAAAGDPG
jgi:hypothetical protein